MRIFSLCECARQEVFMRRINSIFIVLLIAIFFLTAAKMNNGSRIYSRADCKIQVYTIQYLGPLGESNIVEFNYL